MKECKQNGCTNPARTRGWCSLHYNRWRHSYPLDAPVRPRPRPGEWGEWYTTSNGYTRRSRTLGGVQEWQWQHRLVMEARLGRELREGESVHHKNGDRLDNTPQNLELWSVSQPAGQRVVDKLEWAREILNTYEAEFAASAEQGE